MLWSGLVSHVGVYTGFTPHCAFPPCPRKIAYVSPMTSVWVCGAWNISLMLAEWQDDTLTFSSFAHFNFPFLLNLLLFVHSTCKYLAWIVVRLVCLQFASSKLECIIVKKPAVCMYNNYSMHSATLTSYTLVSIKLGPCYLMGSGTFQ